MLQNSVIQEVMGFMFLMAAYNYSSESENCVASMSHQQTKKAAPPTETQTLPPERTQGLFSAV